VPRRLLFQGTVTTAALCCALAGAGTADGATGPAAGPGLTAAPASVSGPLSGDGGSAWGTARELPGFPRLGGYATPESLACPSAGNCSVGGYYNDDWGVQQAFVADEKAGGWRAAVEVPGTAALNYDSAEVTSVSCTSAGNCTAGGDYDDGVSQAFVAEQVRGIWHAAFMPPGAGVDGSGPGAEITSVSCSSPGNCAAGGYTEDDNGLQQALVVDEKNGAWQTALDVPGTVALNTGGSASVVGVWCSSPGNCAADGYYAAGNGNQTWPFVASEKNSRWGSAQPLPFRLASNPFPNLGQIPDAYTGLAPLSCASAGNCGIAGAYIDSHGKTQAFVETEKNGTWQPARAVAAALNAGGDAIAAVITCPSAGNCTAGGAYSAGGSNAGAFVVTERNGTWRPAREVAGALSTVHQAFVDTISCPSVSDCVAGGGYFVPSGNVGYQTSQAFLVTERNGTWQPAQEVAGALNTSESGETLAVACPSARSCTAVGSYFGAAGFSAFIVAGSIVQPP
jgi:hypothetical protein